MGAQGAPGGSGSTGCCYVSGTLQGATKNVQWLFLATSISQTQIKPKNTPEASNSYGWTDSNNQTKTSQPQMGLGLPEGKEGFGFYRSLHGLGSGVWDVMASFFIAVRFLI